MTNHSAPDGTRPPRTRTTGDAPDLRSTDSREDLMTTLRKLAALVALLLVAGSARAAPPKTITYNGFLLDSAGAPVGATSLITFRLYDADTAGNKVYEEAITVLPSASDGYFSATIGLASFLPDAVFNTPLWLAVKYGTEAEMTPRIALSSVPSSFSALRVDWAGIQNRPISSCSGTTPYVTGIDQNGAVTCGAAPGGGASACATGQVLKWSGTAWTCGTDTDTTYTAAVGGPLTLAGTVFSIGAATTSTDGFLSHTDWNTFNSKLSAVTVAAPLSGSGTAASPITLSAANGTTDGYLAHGDWTTFSGKLAAVATSAPLSGSGTTASPLAIATANGTTTGALSATDWLRFDAKVGSVSGSPPLTASGTTAVTLSMTPASNAEPGYLTTSAYGYFASKLDTVALSWPLSGDGTALFPIGLQLGGITFDHLAQNGCGVGDIPKWNGSAWGCAIDQNTGAVMSVRATPGGGLVLGGTAADPLLGLEATGVAAGTYNVVNVDLYGRVVAGGNTNYTLQQTPATTYQAGDIAVDNVYVQYSMNANSLTANSANLNALSASNLSASTVSAGTVSATTFYGSLSGVASEASTVTAGALGPDRLANAGAAPSAGQVPSYNTATTFSWIAPVTKVSAANGSVAVGGSASQPTVGVNYAGTGSAVTAARSDHTHAFAPVAWGSVGPAGAVLNPGSGNWSATWNATSLRYEINVTGVSIYYADFTTIVTPYSGALIPSTSSMSSTTLLVYLYNTAGTAVQAGSGFGFVVYP